LLALRPLRPHDSHMSSVQTFYDVLAESYHLIFEVWDRSIARQGATLHDILQHRWGIAGCSVLDAAVGIGTQALGLAAPPWAFCHRSRRPRRASIRTGSPMPSMGARGSLGRPPAWGSMLSKSRDSSTSRGGWPPFRHCLDRARRQRVFRIPLVADGPHRPPRAGALTV
jgi:hypothetical protein